MINPDGTKRCPACKQNIPTSQFYIASRSARGDGFSGSCKECTKQAARRWIEANPERAKANWAALSESRKLARANGTMTDEQYDAYNAWKRDWYSKNRERYSNVKKAYKARMKEEDLPFYRAKTAIYNNRTRCRKKGIRSDFTITDWKLVVAAFENRCAFCDASPKLLDLDHLFPIHKGGEDVAGNIIPICRPCNSHKNSGDPVEFCALMGKNLEELQKKARVREPAPEFPGHVSEPKRL